MTEQSEKVVLHVYDLSNGLARQFSASFLGKQIEGIWHTGVAVYGKEFFWGGVLQEDYPGRTPYGVPVKTIELGYTHVPYEIFKEYITEISPQYSVETYRLLSNNCNNFSNEVSQFLVGKSIPDDILNLPIDALNTPMGMFIKPFILQMEASIKQQAYGVPAANIPPPNALPFPFPIPPQPTLNPSAFINPLTNTPLTTTSHVPGTNNNNNNNANISNNNHSSTSTATTTNNPPSTPISNNVPKNNPLSPASSADLVMTSQSSLSPKGSCGGHIRVDNKPLISSLGNVSTIVSKLKPQLENPEQQEALEKLNVYLGVHLNQVTGDEIPEKSVYELFDSFVKNIQHIDKNNSGLVFSLFFLLRLLILRKHPNVYYTTTGKDTLLSIFQRFIYDEKNPIPPTVQAMSLTITSNMFSLPTGVEFLLNHDISQIVVEKTIHALQSSSQESVRQPAAALLYNFALAVRDPACNNNNNNDDLSVQIMTGVVDIISKTQQPAFDCETMSRLLMCLGHLLLNNPTLVALFSSLAPNFEQSVAPQLISSIKNPKLTDLVKEVLSILSATI